MAAINKQTQISFIAAQIPALEDGLYTLNLQYQLQYTDNTKEKQLFSTDYSFAVNGERFSLRPDEIHKMFPPPRTQGNYETVLPHIVLKRRTLPWERRPDTTTPPTPGKEFSWLAILLFEADSAPTPVSGSFADLYPPGTADNNGALKDTTIYSYGTTTTSAEFFLQYGENSTDNCTYIDIPKDSFAASAPSLNDLLWNSHARDIEKANGTLLEYAVVVCNKLPVAGMHYVAHLVSLEGLAPVLPQDDGSFATPQSWDTIRLASLGFWPFSVNTLQASFSDILKGLNQGISSTKDGGLSEDGDSQLRLPQGYAPAIAPEQVLTAAFDAGYTLLASGSDSSELCWYRGPFISTTVTTPTTAKISTLLPANNAQELNTATAAATGATIDASYAAAWQIGRLLALSDQAFAIAQVSWKRECRLQLNANFRASADAPFASRSDYAAQMRSVLADETKICALLGTTLTTTTPAPAGQLYIPQYLVDWMAQLALLEGLPFQYLVPDTHMLPVESLRFLQIDPNWIAALLDGAWSLDRQPSSYWCFDTAYQPWQALMNGDLLPSFAAAGCTSIWPASGALMNSQLVPGYWPGIEFEMQPTANILRESTLGQNTLMLLFDQNLSALKIKQPPESLHFGFEFQAQYSLQKTLRYTEIGGNWHPAVPTTPPVIGTLPSPVIGALSQTTLTTLPYRAGTVIQFDALQTAMCNALNIPANIFDASQFALQLVESVTSVEFDIPQPGDT